MRTCNILTCEVGRGLALFDGAQVIGSLVI